ncbi:MAG: FliA/WhiG family RNA polymerase sigma factor [Anaerohalosphaeraceae bacterium]|nr:FliA/WhiG family RNA polymerase sigma factor [Anaerohalosphaeraceae bacterium]
MAVQTEHNSPDTQQEYLKVVARKTYDNQRQRPVSDEQITELLPMVHKIVQRTAVYLKPPLSKDDLVSAGTVGLLKAANDYDPANKASFKTYAYIRIKGAVIDELRSTSFVPSNINQQIRQAEKFSAEITEQKGCGPSDEELAEKMDISVKKLYRMFENARAKQFVSIDRAQDDSSGLGPYLPAENTPAPEERLSKIEAIEKLTDAISQLNQKQRHIIVLYYQQELTMKQIAEVLNVTESRISQLHASALFKLSVKLKEWKDGY